MQFVLEPPTPLDQSSLWRLHDAYFAQKGVAAWHDGEVPSYSTSNYQSALQHVDFFIHSLEERGPNVDPTGASEVWVLEVGSGHGAFAVNFLRALDAHSDAARWAGRIRYLLTDYQARGLDETCALLEVAPHVNAGRIVPALFDLRAPQGFARRDGLPAPDRVQLVVANYVTCVLPLKNLQKHSEKWFEQYVSIGTKLVSESDSQSAELLLAEMLSDATRANLCADELDLDFTWVESPLSTLYADVFHREVVTNATAAHDEATIGYPHGFVDFMRLFAARLSPSGYFLINDYGSVNSEDLEGLSDRRPEFYGNSLANAINFAIFDALGDATGWGVLRTRAPEEVLHTAVLRPHTAWSSAADAWFHAAYVAQRGCDDVLDFWTAAHRLAEDKDLDGALRYWSRLIRLEPQHVDHYYRAGVVAIEANRVELARALLEHGQELAAGDPRFDFWFELGRAYCLLDQNDAAIAAYQASLIVDPHSVTFTNLGVVLEEQGELHRAFRAYRAAQAADPEDPRPLERMTLLRDRIWGHTLESWEGEDVVDPLAVAPVAAPDHDMEPHDIVV